MTALALRRAVKVRKFSNREVAATVSDTYYEGALICFDTSTALAVVGKTSTTLIPIGLCAEDTVIPAGGGSIPVAMFEEVTVAWMANDATHTVEAALIGSVCYIVDDQTVADDDATNTRSVAGRVWEISSTKGVLVQFMAIAGQRTNSGLDG